MEDSIVIVFMRHGRSLADDEEVYEGRYDSPLTETGREQARTRAREWQAEGIRFDHIVASPLVRAAETAEIVGQTLNMGFETDPNWMEVDNGPLAGRSYGDPQAQSLWRPIRNPFVPYTTTGEGESTWELHCRAIRALQQMVRRGPGQFLVVAHGGILNAALHCIVGAQPSMSGQGIRFSFGDTGYAWMVYYPKRHCWVLKKFMPGDFDHRQSRAKVNATVRC